MSGDEFAEVRMKRKHFAAFAECQEMTGIPIQELLDGMHDEYVEATISVYMEGAAERAGSHEA